MAECWNPLKTNLEIINKIPPKSGIFCLISHDQFRYMILSLKIIGIIIIVMSLIPLIRKDFWIFRVFEYPRLQKLAVNIFLLIVYAIYQTSFQIADYIFITALLLNMFYLLVLIFPFSRFSKKQIGKTSNVDEENAISLMIFNVYQHNKNSKACLSLIEKTNPDIVCLVETDAWWQNEVSIIEKQYPFKVLKPLENTYGMLLYSKLALLESSINFIVKDDIPSIQTQVELKSGKKVKLYCVHPEPPVPNENPKSTARDKELLLVAKDAEKQNLPVIVMGDLNDVAWSYTTDLFCKISKLLDPRKGRGFFNTFNAKIPIMRFPLDHIFCSDDFCVTSIKRLPFAGSDHYPMYIKLQYADKNAVENEPEAADNEEKELADEKINKPVE